MKTIAVLGSTGSIGTQTLEVARANGDLKIAALAAGRNVKLLERQIREFSPRVVAVWEEEAARELKTAISDLDVKIVTGMDGLIEISTLPEVEVLVTAIVGMIGIRPTVEAIKAGKDIALANKETLVTAELIREKIQKVLEEQHISERSISRIASIDLKAEEKGLLETARDLNVEFVTYTAEELKNVKGDFTESAFVASVTGVSNVCERSAVRGSDYGVLICRKTAGDGVTVALAVEEYMVDFTL